MTLGSTPSHPSLIADSFFEASQINELLLVNRTAEEIVDELRQRGITHVLRWSRSRGIPYPREFRALMRDPDYAHPLFEDRWHRLYELRPPTSEP